MSQTILLHFSVYNWHNLACINKFSSYNSVTDLRVLTYQKIGRPRPDLIDIRRCIWSRIYFVSSLKKVICFCPASDGFPFTNVWREVLGTQIHPCQYICSKIWQNSHPCEFPHLVLVMGICCDCHNLVGASSNERILWTTSRLGVLQSINQSLVFKNKRVKYIDHLSHHNMYCIVLYGVVIAAQCTATILRSIVLPRI